ncbi:hypothetical protein [Bifidobacterium castoris]|uniref:PhnA protein n=1 Tax=Bifidobacterium castoris TaxID=2306972 RepID=A0A430F4E9_9BIFI|nr:hypothetical protein [Bifidobacterium castoris]RSX44678.1 PhnA protein [Bifidobacterium castoris]
MTCPMCNNPSTPTICRTCKRQTAQDLAWLANNCDDLEHYRLNRAYGKHAANSGGGRRTEAPTPVREAIYDALYVDRYRNLKQTLNTWAMCFSQPPAPEGCLAQQARILDGLDLWTPGKTAASAIYAAETHILVTRLCAILANMDETRIHLGICPNPECARPVYAAADAREATCAHCNNTWTATILRRATDAQLCETDAEGTAGELALMLDQVGIEVAASTIRSWASRGKLMPILDKNGHATKRYKLTDAYRLTDTYRQQHLD